MVSSTGRRPTVVGPPGDGATEPAWRDTTPNCVDDDVGDQRIEEHIARWRPPGRRKIAARERRYKTPAACG